MLRAGDVGHQPRLLRRAKWDIAHHIKSMTSVLDLIGNTPMIETQRLGGTAHGRPRTYQTIRTSVSPASVIHNAGEIRGSKVREAIG